MKPFDDDPVLRWLPDEPPSAFLLMDPEEQQFRGRCWIVLYGAGYEPDHAWGLVLTRDPAFDASARKSIARIPNDDAYGEMVRGRRYAEDEMRRAAATGAV